MIEMDLTSNGSTSTKFLKDRDLARFVLSFYKIGKKQFKNASLIEI